MEKHIKKGLHFALVIMLQDIKCYHAYHFNAQSAALIHSVLLEYDAVVARQTI